MATAMIKRLLFMSSLSATRLATFLSPESVLGNVGGVGDLVASRRLQAKPRAAFRLVLRLGTGDGKIDHIRSTCLVDLEGAAMSSAAWSSDQWLRSVMRARVHAWRRRGRGALVILQALERIAPSCRAT
jgi:hypothetical protein